MSNTLDAPFGNGPISGPTMLSKFSTSKSCFGLAPLGADLLQLVYRILLEIEV